MLERISEWLQRIRGAKQEIVVYQRETGCICFEVPLFVDRDAPPSDFFHELLSSGLSWCWASVRQYPTAEDSPLRGLPEERPPTMLTPDNVQLLSEEFRELDSGEKGRTIFLFGVDSDSVLGLLDPRTLHSALRAFAEREASPIRLVFLRVGDSVNKYIFVPHEPIDQVKRLLYAWGIDSNALYKARPYKALGVVRLECLHSLPGHPEENIGGE